MAFVFSEKVETLETQKQSPTPLFMVVNQFLNMKCIDFAMSWPQHIDSGKEIAYNTSFRMCKL